MENRLRIPWRLYESTHLYYRFNVPEDTAGWGILLYQDNVYLNIVSVGIFRNAFCSICEGWRKLPMKLIAVEGKSFWKEDLKRKQKSVYNAVRRILE